MTTKLNYKGNLRFIQAFAGMGPICDCGLCGGRALVLCADDNRKGFALSQRCADETGVLDQYKTMADGVKEFVQGDSVKVPLPSWKLESMREYCLDLSVLLHALGVNTNFRVRAHGVSEVEIYIPEQITTAKPPERNVAHAGR